MRIRASSLLLILIALLVARAAAGEAFDPVARARIVAPFIDEQTLAVVYVDFSRVPVDRLVDSLAGGIVDLDEPQASRLKEELGSMQGGFAKAGGKDFYAVIDAADVPEDWPLLVVPLAAGADKEALAKVPLLGLREPIAEQVGSCLLIGRPATLARARGIKPDPRPELAEAFRAAGDTPVQAVLTPPRYAVRVIEELLPTLPAMVGGGPSQVLTDGLRWAAAGIELEPQASLGLVVKSQDGTAAKSLHAKLAEMFGQLGNREEVRRDVPAFDELVPLLTPQLKGDSLTLRNSPECLAAVLSLASLPLQDARTRAKQTASMVCLKQLSVAMHVFHEEQKTFPAAASYDADGKPLLSWRVHILPFIGQEGLYRQFHLDEPWDSQHNRTLIERMPALYRCPTAKADSGKTVYLVPVGEETVFPGREGIPLKEIKDGAAQTVMIVEADDQHAVVWTSPEDLPFDPDDPARGLGGPERGGFHAAFCDGHVELVPLPQDAAILRALFTRAAGDRTSR